MYSKAFTEEQYAHIKQNGFNPKICQECQEIDRVLKGLSANAPLVSQAPKLCEACKQALDVFERLADWGDLYQDDKRLALLRKAIASVEEK